MALLHLICIHFSRDCSNLSLIASPASFHLDFLCFDRPWGSVHVPPLCPPEWAFSPRVAGSFSCSLVLQQACVSLLLPPQSPWYSPYTPFHAYWSIEIKGTQEVLWQNTDLWNQRELLHVLELNVNWYLCTLQKCLWYVSSTLSPFPAPTVWPALAQNHLSTSERISGLNLEFKGLNLNHEPRGETWSHETLMQLGVVFQSSSGDEVIRFSRLEASLVGS